MRKSLILGNWKMHGNRASVERLSLAIRSVAKSAGVEVGVCPPFPYLLQVGSILKDSPVVVGAQDVCGDAAEEGAYTGEVSATMLKDCGASLVLIGHSERRSLYAENDDSVLRKTSRALQVGLMPVVCVGESLGERDGGMTLSVIRQQVMRLLDELDATQWQQLILAYEPVWAIGTGKTASPEQAQEVHAYLRGLVATKYPDVAKGIKIIYGGSVKPQNAAELFEQVDIDGALVGGASLSPDDFAAIVGAAE